MTIWWILLLAVGAIPAFLLLCFIVGVVLGIAEALGIPRKVKPVALSIPSQVKPEALGLRRKPKLRVIRCEEEETD